MGCVTETEPRLSLNVLRKFKMLSLLFPRVIDNTYRGQRLGYWLLAPVLFLKIGIGLASIFNPRGANQADAIDLSSFSTVALREEVTTTALLGLLHLAIGLFCVLAMVRYRAMTQMIYFWLIAEFIGRRVVLSVYTIDRVDGPSSGSYVNLALAGMLAMGFALSLWRRRGAPH
jgi:hypothetical protein